MDLDVAQQGRPVTRRRFSNKFKRELVTRCLAPGASVARIAREHDLNTNQVFKWCRRFGPQPVTSPPPLLPVTLIDSADRAPAPGPAQHDGTIEIELSNARVRITGSVDADALRTAIEALRAR